MGRPSDREFQLQRKLKDAEAKNKVLENEIAQLKKKIDKLEQGTFTKTKTTAVKPNLCPSCNVAELKILEIPGKHLHICAKACGWKEVK